MSYVEDLKKTMKGQKGVSVGKPNSAAQKAYKKFLSGSKIYKGR